MPISITIRSVPDEVRDELAARAARSGRSLQEYLVHELTRLAGKRTVDDVLDGIRRRAEHFPPLDREAVHEMIARSRE
jgi:Mg/Co/Ni transporter MgtE